MRIFGRLAGHAPWRLAACLSPLALRALPAQCGKHEEVERYRKEAARMEQLKEATEWCKASGKRGYAASHRTVDGTEDWLWPLVTEGSVNRRLNGTVDADHPFAAHSVLTPAEESDLVQACKELGAHAQGIGREQIGKMVLDSLLLRATLNEGRDFTPLSHNAKQIVSAGEVGQSFFTRFFADHPDVSEKRPASEEILRAKLMTREVSASHFVRLRECLERADLLDALGKIKDPRRVLNSDECPNPWRGTGHRGKVVVEVGKPCVKLVTAAREHSTLDVLIGLDGHLYDAHVIFKGEYVQRQMIPDRSKLPNCKISATSKGYQTGSTLLDTLRHWDKQLLVRGIPKPVVWTTDGHSSRLNSDVLRWCRENQWIMYISPPHTTGIHQALDQIFKTWHDTFNGIVERWSKDNTGTELNKRVFTDMLAEAWGKWTDAGKIVNAFKRVGISVSGVDPKAVPEAKFIISHSVAKPAPALTGPTTPALTAPTTPALTGPTTRATVVAAGSGVAGPSTAVAPAASVDWTGEWKSPSPDASFEKDSKEYWREKQKLTSARAKELFSSGKTMHATPQTLKATHPAWNPKRASPTPDDGKKGTQRVKGQWGDMDACQMLERLEEQDREEETAKDAVQQRREAREQQKQLKEAEAKVAREEKDARLEEERPVTDLLKSLRFVPEQNDDASAAELQLFARTNRPELVGIGVDLSTLVRKHLMPQLVAKMVPMPAVTWKPAPPKALPAPPQAAAPAPALPPVDSTPEVQPAALVLPTEERGEDAVESSPTAKRPRRASAGK